MSDFAVKLDEARRFLPLKRLMEQHGRAPAGMSPHGFAMDWPLAETNEPLTCHLCLQFAFRWRNQDGGLKAMLPVDTFTGPRSGGVACRIPMPK